MLHCTMIYAHFGFPKHVSDIRICTIEPNNIDLRKKDQLILVKTMWKDWIAYWEKEEVQEKALKAKKNRLS